MNVSLIKNLEIPKQKSHKPVNGGEFHHGIRRYERERSLKRRNSGRDRCWHDQGREKRSAEEKEGPET